MNVTASFIRRCREASKKMTSRGRAVWYDEDLLFRAYFDATLQSKTKLFRLARDLGVGCLYDLETLVYLRLRYLRQVRQDVQQFKKNETLSGCRQTGL